MLRIRREPDGEVVLVRERYRPEDYTPSDDDLSPIRNMGWLSVRELMHMPDGPFGNFWVEKVERDGKTWWQLCEKMKEWCVLIEDSELKINWGEIRIVPPDGARDISRSYDTKRGRRVVHALPTKRRTMSALEESYSLDASQSEFIHVRHLRIDDSGHGTRVDMGGHMSFERANLPWVVETLRACLTTYAFPETTAQLGQDHLIVFESGPEQEPITNLWNRRAKDAPHGGIHILAMSKPLAQNLLDDLGRLLQNSSP